MGKIVGKIYSDALFELALDNKELNQVYEEIKATYQALSENDELLKFLNHPKISKDEKIRMIENVFKGNYSDTTVGFLVTIVTKGRYNEIFEIFEYFINAVMEYKKIGKATVVSASELTVTQKDKIEDRLLKTTHYVEFKMNYEVDPTILGGLIIRIGDRVVDSSIKSKIEVLKKDLIKLQLAN